MSRPIVFFDLETTGTDVAKDRIVSLAFEKYNKLGDFLTEQYYQIFNPGILMSDEVVACHGITNEEAQGHLPFRDSAKGVYDAIQGCDLCGYNLLNFDVPMLWEEFHRAGITWDLTGVRIIDAGNIFKKKEERKLSAAVKFYCAGKEHLYAHNAAGDTSATVAVLEGQLKRYDDLAKMSIGELAEFSRFDDRVDLAGKIVRDKDGDPSYAIGKSKGKKVKDDLGFGYWMLDKDFSAQTKLVLEKIIREIEFQRAINRGV